MNKTDKMTNVKALDYVLENCELTEEVAEKIGKIKASYEKKSSTTGERKPTATQVANEALKEAIVAEMEDGKAYRISDMLKEFECLAGLTSSKATYLMTKLKEESKVVRSEDKGKAFYTKA